MSISINMKVLVNSHQLVLRFLSHGLQMPVLERVPDEGGPDLGDDPGAKVGRLLQTVVRTVAVAVTVKNHFDIELALSFSHLQLRLLRVN